MKSTILRVISLVMVLVLSASFMFACKDEETEAPLPTPEADPTLYDLTGFKIVREDMGNQRVSSTAVDLKNAIADIIGISLEVCADSDVEAGDKEILIGETDRAESVSTIQYLEKKNKTDNSYAIRIGEGKIVLTGTDELSTRRAVYEFIDDYVKKSPEGNSVNIAAGTQQFGVYEESKIITTSSGIVIHVDQAGQMFSVNNTRYEAEDGCVFVPTSASYPSITELRYQKNPEDNGKLIATMSITASDFVPPASATTACVMMSEDQGRTWKALSRPVETLHLGLSSVGSMAHVYELPAQVGDMPAGTLLYSYNAVNYSHETNGKNGRSILAVWRSYDCGVTWEEYVVIDEAKGIAEGIWEPFMIYCEEDQYLYCFYSDDSDPEHDQKISYKRSKDGVHWEGEGGKIGTGTGKDVEPVDVVAVNDFEYRPGMPVITKMGNGEYFLVYEQFGDWSGCPIYYKTTKNLADWGDASDIGTLIQTPKGETFSSSPACIWIDTGTEGGLLIVTAKAGSNKGFMFISTDYGKTWEKISNPLTGKPIATGGSNDRVGYSPAFWLSTDGKTLYYINSINDSKSPDNTRTMGFARITIYGPLKY